jgi:hypothetical protein
MGQRDKKTKLNFGGGDNLINTKMNNYLKKTKRGTLNDLNLCYIIADACCFLNQKKKKFFFSFFASLNLTNFFVIVGKQIAKFSISQN